MKITQIISALILISSFSFPQGKIFIPMDLQQTDHLKAYGITYHALEKGYKADWLLNYRGGSFLIDYSNEIATECLVEGVYSENISMSDASAMYAEIQVKITIWML